MNPSLLIIERPGSFRDALVSEIQLSGAQPHVRDDAMDALAAVRELSPDLVLVSEDPGPPGAASVCRLMRRSFSNASVFRLGDPAERDLLDEQSPFVPRAIGAVAIARFLLQRAENRNDAADVPHRAWDAPVGSLELGPLLTAVADRRLTGRLVLSGQSVERELAFARGMLVWSRSSVFSERLGQVALRQNLLNPQQLDQALDLARSSERRLGEVLVERGTFDAPKLFVLLCAQFTEQVAAACNNGAVQARFVLDESVVQQNASLRLHPLSAMLIAVRKTAKEDIGRVLDQLADRTVSAESVSAAVKSWLAAAGVPDVTQLLTSVTSVRVLRERLRERFPKDGSDVEADAITLALLRAGALKLPGRASLVPADLRTGMTTLSPPSVASAVVRCARATFDDWPLTALRQARTPLEAALDAYLQGPKSADAARAAALRGPSAEASEVDPELLSLSLRASGSHARHPGTWLQVTPGASAREVRLACHALLARLDGQVDDPERPVERLRRAELRAALRRALAALDAAGVLEAQRASEPPAASAKPAAMIASGDRASREAVSAIKDRLSHTHAGDPLLLSQVEPLVQQARWSELKTLLAGEDQGKTLSPAFTLLYAIALKEDASSQESAHGTRHGVDAEALGIAAVSELLSIPPHSATALVIAKRTLRRRPLEWTRKASGRASFFFVLLALLLGAGVGTLLSPQLLQLFTR